MRSRPAIYLWGAALLLLAALLIAFAFGGLAGGGASAASWERARGGSAIFGKKGGRSAINAVIAAGPGLVAVGYEAPGAAVWTSSDGRTWSRAGKGDSSLGGSRAEGMSAVARNGSELIAAGGVESSDWDAAVWTSTDALHWRRVDAGAPVFGGKGDQYMRGLVAGSFGLVAVGFDGSDAAVWRSKDGAHWTRVADSALGGDGKQEMDAVAAGGPGLVAVGSSNGDAAIWTSTDGRSWRRVEAGSPVFAGAGEQKMYAVGPAGRGLVAVGYDNGIAAAWASGSGSIWRRAAISGSDGQAAAVWSEMLAVGSGGPGLVAVGVTSTGFGGSDAAVWTSKDGSSWQSVPDSAQFSGSEGNQALAGVTSGGPGLVAVGDDNNTAAVWTSSG